MVIGGLCIITAPIVLVVRVNSVCWGGQAALVPGVGWAEGPCGARLGYSPCALLPSAWGPRGCAGRMEEAFGTEETLKRGSRRWKWITRGSGQR